MMDLTELNIIKASIEIFSALFCLLIAGTLYQITKSCSKESKVLIAMLFTNTGLLLSDALCYITDGYRANWEYTVNEMCSLFQFFGNPVLNALGIAYIGLRLSGRQGGIPRLLRWNIAFTTIISMAIPLVNLFYPVMYRIDGANVYHRLPGWYCYSGILAGSLLLTIGLLVVRRRQLGGFDFGASIFFCLAPVLGISLQAYSSVLPMVNIFCTAAVLTMAQGYLRKWLQEIEDYTSLESKQKRDRQLIINLTLVMVFCLLTSVSFSALAALDTAKKYNRESSCIIAENVTEVMERVFRKSIDVSEKMAASEKMRLLLAAPELQEGELKEYLESVKELSGAELVFVISDDSKAYYTEKGYKRQLEEKKDVWYAGVKSAATNYKINMDHIDAERLHMGVFVNARVYNTAGRLLGISGTCFGVDRLAETLKSMEEEYGIKIYLTNATGLVQLSSDKTECRAMHLNIDEFENVNSNKFTYRYHDDHVHLVRFIPYLNCYLVVMDYQPDKISMLRLIAPSVFVLVLGVLLVFGVYRIYTRQSRKLESELSYRDRLAKCDGLTGLGNRYALDCLRREPHAPGWQEDLTVLMLDVNGLKNINDTLGHAAGDELIIGAANSISKVLGDYGRVFRVGGDEFVSYIHCGAEELPEIMEKLQACIDTWQGTMTKELSVSVGSVSSRDNPGATLEELEAAADKVMYLNKAEYYRQRAEKFDRPAKK